MPFRDLDDFYGGAVPGATGDAQANAGKPNLALAGVLDYVKLMEISLLDP